MMKGNIMAQLCHAGNYMQSKFEDAFKAPDSRHPRPFAGQEDNTNDLSKMLENDHKEDLT